MKRAVIIAIVCLVGGSAAIAAPMHKKTKSGEKAATVAPVPAPLVPPPSEPAAAPSAPEGEFVISYSKPYFLAQNGYEELVKVKFEHSSVEKALPESKLKDIAKFAVMICKFHAKNQISYVPFKLFIYGGDDGSVGSLHVSLEWLGKNAYGAEGSEKCFLKLDENYFPVDLFP